MTVCRTLAEIDAAAEALAATWPRPSQALVNRVAAILAPYQPAVPDPARLSRAQAARTAA